MIRHCIFDCFGTLLDTGSGSVDAAREILSNVGSDADPAVFYADWKAVKKRMMRTLPFEPEKALFVRSLSETFARFGIDADGPREAEPMIRSLFGPRRAFPDVKAALAMLEDRGIDCAVGSTTDTDALYCCLRQNGLRFSRICTSEDVRVYKPDPRFYETLLRWNGWDAADCLFVGDSYEDDVQGPKAAGMRAVLLDRKGVFRQPETGVRPDAVIRSLTELPEAVFR